MPTIWNKNPPEGFRCLVGTQRILDEHDHCCDYNRCGAYRINWRTERVDRCLMDQGHHYAKHTMHYWDWWDADAWAIGRDPGTLFDMERQALVDSAQEKA